MSYGKMSTFIDIISTTPVKDSEGFATKGEVIIASVRAYMEERHGNEAWKNRATFSTATALFRFRKIPGVEVTENHILISTGSRYEIQSVEDVRNRGLYIEVLCKKVEASG